MRPGQHKDIGNALLPPPNRSSWPVNQPSFFSAQVDLAKQTEVERRNTLRLEQEQRLAQQAAEMAAHAELMERKAKEEEEMQQVLHEQALAQQAEVTQVIIDDEEEQEGWVEDITAAKKKKRKSGVAPPLAVKGETRETIKSEPRPLLPLHRVKAELPGSPSKESVASSSCVVLSLRDRPGGPPKKP